MRILVTGCAGFIGFSVVRELIKTKNYILGIDNLNRYYSRKLKLDRIKTIKRECRRKNFVFFKKNINNYKQLSLIFKKNKIDVVLHLAAQAGVRYSLVSPKSYLNNNIIGFFNILNLSKKFKVKHLIYASTSSVYGDNKKFPLKENLKTDTPLQFYAATKKSNEIFAYSYSHLYKLKTTGLRFFTVYGPWGRPDMALFKFTKNILQGKPIEIYNFGNHRRDFTYIDDIVKGITSILFLKTSKKENKLYQIVNLANNKSVKLMQYIKEIEKNLKKKSIKKFLPIQKGDIVSTHGSISLAKTKFKFMPKTNVRIGVKKFVDWYKTYYSNKIIYQLKN